MLLPGEATEELRPALGIGTNRSRRLRKQIDRTAGHAQARQAVGTMFGDVLLNRRADVPRGRPQEIKLVIFV